MMLFETERTIIRYFTMEDAADLQEILGDAETMQFCEPAYTMEKTRHFLKTFCIDRRGALAAELKSIHKAIGYILFSETVPGTYELGWFFNRAYWRQGYALESCKAVLDYAFREKNACKIFAETIDPEKSVSLMKKLGMKPEGIQDRLYVYGISRKDWMKSEPDSLYIQPGDYHSSDMK